MSKDGGGYGDSRADSQGSRLRNLETKLVEANTIMELMAKALEFYADEENMRSLTGLPFGRRARETMPQYEQFKKESGRE